MAAGGPISIGDGISVLFRAPAAGIDTDLTSALVEFIGATEKQLLCAVSELTSPRILEALAQVAQTQRDIQIVYDAGPGRGATEKALASVGLVERARAVGGGRRTMRHRYFVRDSQSVWTGSAAPTQRGLEQQDNVCLVLDSGPVAQGYQTAFLSLGVTSPLESMQLPNLQVLFTPNRGTPAAIGRIVTAAKRSVYVLAVHLSDPTITAALKRAADRGLDVRGIYEPHQESAQVRKTLWFLDDPRFVATASQPRPNGPTMHAAAIVVDELQVIAASASFSDRLAETNGDVMTIHSPLAAAAFLSYFNELHAFYSSERPTPEPKPSPEEPPPEPAPEPPARIELGTLGGAGNDTVAEQDQLGFRHYVEAFADLLTSEYLTPPLTIGIFGSWGMGKSFLLEHIKGEITRRQDEKKEKGLPVEPRVHIVRFNAWEYNATDVVWPGLVRKIVKALDEDVAWPWYKRRWTRLRWNLPRELARVRGKVVVAVLGAAAVAGITLWQAHEPGLAKAVAALAGALGLGSVLTAAAHPIARWVTALFEESDYGRQLGSMEEIKYDLKGLERRLHDGGKPGGRIVGRILVLIDDLDRCEPEKAVEVLQAVNLLLNFKSFVVCLGIDARIVTGAIEKHYAGLLRQAGASGYEYLDKIVQIPFRIPEPSEGDIKAFIGKQLGDPRPAAAEPSAAPAQETAEDGLPGGEAPQPEVEAEAIEPVKEDEKEVEAHDETETPADEPEEAKVPFTYPELQAFELVVPFLRRNPRHLKRLVNVYRLVRALARARAEEALLRNPATTIRWLVMWSQWPYTSHAMLTHFEAVRRTWRTGKPPKDLARRDPLLYLFNSVEKGLNEDTRRLLDDEPADLRALLQLPDGRLRWDELPKLLHYTVNFNPAVEERLRALATPQEETSPAA